MVKVFGEKLLDGKVAIVTGGGSGINLAIATRYAQSGCGKWLSNASASDCGRSSD